MILTLHILGGRQNVTYEFDLEAAAEMIWGFTDEQLNGGVISLAVTLFPKPAAPQSLAMVATWFREMAERGLLDSSEMTVTFDDEKEV